MVQPGKYNTSEGVPFQAGSTQVSASTACRNCKFKFVKFPLKFPSLALDSGSAALNTTVPSYKRARYDMLSDYSPAKHTPTQSDQPSGRRFVGFVHVWIPRKPVFTACDGAVCFGASPSNGSCVSRRPLSIMTQVQTTSDVQLVKTRQKLDYSKLMTGFNVKLDASENAAKVLKHSELVGWFAISSSVGASPARAPPLCARSTSRTHARNVPPPFNRDSH